MKKEYLQIDKVVGPLIQISDVDDVFYGEVVDIVEISTGNIKKGKVIKIEEKNVIIRRSGSGKQHHQIYRASI
jgi:V/A-type H+-transporting ATPase subunit B